MRASVGLAAVVLAAPAPKTWVIRLNDLPKGFQTIKAHSYALAAAAKRNQQSVAQLRSWGFVTAYEADYGRAVRLTPTLKGPFVVQSAVSVYKATAGAKLSLARSSSGCRNGLSTELKTSVKIGDEVHLCRNLTSSNGVVVVVYAVLWRRGSHRGSLFVDGVRGGLTAAQVLALAKTQDSRMK